MKYIFFLAINMISISLVAQEFCNNSSEWHYRYSNQATSGCVKLKFEKDTIIQGENYKEFYKHYDVRNSLSGQESSGKSSPEYIRSDEGKVYAWLNNHNKFTLLFDFTLDLNETWEIDLANWPIDNKSKILCTVLELGTEIIDNKELKWQRVKFYINDIYTFEDKIYEDFGLLTYALFPWDEFYGYTDGNELGNFIRYIDESFDYNTNSFSNCDESTSIDEEFQTKHLIYPNPVTSTLNIKYHNYDQRFRILNQYGKLVIEGNSSDKIDVSNLENGLYFFEFLSKTDNEIIKLIKI